MSHSPPSFKSLTTPTYRASTVVFERMADIRAANWLETGQISYGLQDTPTTLALAQQLADIEQAKHCVLLPSGASAINIIYLTLLTPNSHILVMNNVYDPNRLQAEWLKRFCPDLEIEYYSPHIGQGLTDKIKSNTKLIWMEAPGSITMEVANIPLLAQIAKQQGVLCAIDNTWSAGVFFKPFSYPIDFSVQALTKYQSGGSDVLMGAVLTQDAELHKQLQFTRNRLGIGVSSDDCSLILRSLPSMPVRLEKQGQIALHIANQLKKHPAIKYILHPAHSDCPGHEYWQRDFMGASSLFSVMLQDHYTLSDADRVVDHLKHFSIGYSWGGSHSLALSSTPSLYRLPQMQQDKIYQNDNPLIRIYIGLEDPVLLLNDLWQSLDRLTSLQNISD